MWKTDYFSDIAAVPKFITIIDKNNNSAKSIKLEEGPGDSKAWGIDDDLNLGDPGRKYTAIYISINLPPGVSR